jgi:zinc transport system ATP-binding protein
VRPAIHLDRVRIVRDRTSILEDCSAQFPAEKLSAVIGPNGAGKTTLVHAVLGLIEYDGSIRFEAASGPLARRPRIGYVPQRLDFDRGTPLTVLDLFAMAGQRWPIWLGTTRSTREAARRHLERVDAAGLLDRRLGKLSGGELQRVQLAVALRHEPEVLILDEPVSGVDVKGERLFCDLLDRIRKEDRLTTLMVLHDLAVVEAHADHIVCLNRTVQAAGAPRDVLTPATLSRVFGTHAALYGFHQPQRGPDHQHCAHPGADGHDPDHPGPATAPVGIGPMRNGGRDA